MNGMVSEEAVVEEDPRVVALERKCEVYREALVAIATPGPTFATTFKRGSTRGNSMRECRRIAVKALAAAQ